VSLLAQVDFPNTAWLTNPRTWERIAGHLVEHVQLTVLGVLAGLVLAAPLAILAVRQQWLRASLLAFAGVVYTVPSLVMFLLIIVVLGTGFGTTSMVIGLGLYALLVLLRNIVTGLEAVPADIREAGEAMGYTRNQLLARVELPVALPVILAGVRIATISTIGLVTITALFGKGGLGRLFLTGYNRQDLTIVLVGVVLTFLLALIADGLLLLAQRWATPWSRGRTS
jgi:osmoprotectant transport system permease protein